mmetsp:Transcript_30813/g.87161  ORF Transcript_30813/g.87161 Transcript_30813/m.87161 type:complete len:221 (+) Transcript_30813:119-781(+)
MRWKPGRASRNRWAALPSDERSQVLQGFVSVFVLAGLPAPLRGGHNAPERAAALRAQAPHLHEIHTGRADPERQRAAAALQLVGLRLRKADGAHWHSRLSPRQHEGLPHLLRAHVQQVLGDVVKALQSVAEAVGRRRGEVSTHLQGRAVGGSKDGHQEGRGLRGASQVGHASHRQLPPKGGLHSCSLLNRSVLDRGANVLEPLYDSIRDPPHCLLQVRER